MDSYLNELMARYSLSDLHGQFVVTRDTSFLPENWSRRSCRGWFVAHHDGVPVIDLKGEDGEPAGWVIGWLLGADGKVIRGAFPACTTDLRVFERQLYAGGGRFVAVLLASYERIYLDPTGSLSLVYSPRHGLVASTTPLIPMTEGCDYDLDLASLKGLPWRRGEMLFGTTLRRGVERLLPNHYLDLATWQGVRHYPLDGLEVDDDTETATQRIADLMRIQIEGLAAEYPLYIPLTGGRDSRTMLACARGVIDRTCAYTFDIAADEVARKDVEIARTLAERLHFRHQVMPDVEPDPDDIHLWNFRTGGELGEPRGQQSLATRRALPRDAADVIGVGGELGRRSHWKRGENARSPIDAESLITRSDSPITPETRRRAEDWLANLPARDTLRIIDFLMIECHLGSWSGLIPYAEPGLTAVRIYPFCQREALERMMRLPTPYRRKYRLTDAIIGREWPELLEVPFDHVPDDSSPRKKRVIRAMRDPAWAIGKVRSRMGR